MKSQTSKVIGLLFFAVLFIIWVFRMSDFFQVEQKNDRIEISNSVVRLINDIQQKTEGPQSFFKRFLTIDELDESKQRGTWALLEMSEFNYQKDIDLAKLELKEMFSGEERINKEDQKLMLSAQKLLDSYSAYDPVYQQIAQAIKRKNLSTAQLETLLNEQYQYLASITEQSVQEFQVVQNDYIKGL